MNTHIKQSLMFMSQNNNKNLSESFKKIEKALKAGKSYENFDIDLNDILDIEINERNLEIESIWENNKHDK